MVFSICLLRKKKLMAKNNKKTETAQEILDGFKMKFMVAITVIFFGSMVAAFIWLFLKSSL
tara:strand:+ start:159 stop:341 length:183 start_codon:yes stop_codon:yes gene_type:complete